MTNVVAKRRRILKWVEYAISIFLLIAVAYGVLGYATGTIPYYVVSDHPSSMAPTLSYGWVAVLYKTPFSSIKPGDIIAFHDPRGNPGIIIHRVVGIDTINCINQVSQCLITKGDNNATNPTPDPWDVTQQFYIGQVILIVPYVGYFTPSMWSSLGSLGYSPLILVIVLVVLLSYIQSLRNPNRRETEKEIASSSKN